MRQARAAREQPQGRCGRYRREAGASGCAGGAQLPRQGQPLMPLLRPRNGIGVRTAANQAVPAPQLLELRYLLIFCFYFRLLLLPVPEREAFTVCPGPLPLPSAGGWAMGPRCTALWHCEAPGLPGLWQVPEGQEQPLPMEKFCHTGMALQQDKRSLPFTPKPCWAHTKEPGLAHSSSHLGPKCQPATPFQTRKRD